MEFNHNKVRRVDEDRLSSLSDDLLHKILSSFDIKFVVQTCILSSRWKLLWTTMPCLNFSTWQFRLLREFAQFVTHVLSHRNNQIEVPSVDLCFYGAQKYESFVGKIVNYAFSHNVQQLTVKIYTRSRRVHNLPFILSSQSLKQFRLDTHIGPPRITLKTSLDLPALTTLCLCGVQLMCRDLFSKCVNLKNLTLVRFKIMGREREFDIITPRLSNLRLFDGTRYYKVMNLIAPQLENLTVRSCSLIRHLNAPPGLSSFCYRDKFNYQAMFHKVTTMPYEKEDAWNIFNMLQKLHMVRYLTLHVTIVECISSFPDILLRHPSPFSNLICLTIVDSNMREDGYKVKLSPEAKNYLLENSPSATITTAHEYPKGC